MHSSVVGQASAQTPSTPVSPSGLLTMMMKHDHIGKTDNVGHQQAGSAQGPMHCPYHY